MMNTESDPRSYQSEIFDAVVEGNYSDLANIFAENARKSVASYLNMKSRWSRRQDSMSKSGMYQKNQDQYFCWNSIAHHTLLTHQLRKLSSYSQRKN